MFQNDPKCLSRCLFLLFVLPHCLFLNTAHAQREPVRVFEHLERDTIPALAFSPDGSLLATGSGGGVGVNVWDVATGERLVEFTEQQAAINYVAFSPDGKWVVSTSDGPRAMVWDARTGEVITVITPPLSAAWQDWLGLPPGVGPAAFSPDGSKLVTCRTGTAVIWDLASKNEIQRFSISDSPGYVRFYPDGRRILTRGFDGRIGKTSIVYDMESRGIVYVLADANAVLSDGRLLSVGAGGASGTRAVMEWDLLTGEAVRKSPDFIIPGGKWVFSPDGEYLLYGQSGSSRTTESPPTRLMNAGTLVAVAEFPLGLREDEAVGRLAFSADSSMIVIVVKNKANLFEISDLTTAIRDAPIRNQ